MTGATSVTWTMRRRLATILAAGTAGSLLAMPAAAQFVDVHGLASVETVGQSTSWGGGLGYGRMFLPAGVGLLGVSVGARHMRGQPLGKGAGADYMREQHLGRGLATASLDLTLSRPTPNARFVPYAGGGLTFNWSGGQ